MATSNDTRVRVDGFSKIIASVDSAIAGGLNLAGVFLPARFMACAMSMMPRSVLASSASRSRKCLGCGTLRDFGGHGTPAG